MTQYRISEVASLLSVSDDTVRRWIETENIPVALDASGRQVVAGQTVAAHAVALANAPDDPSTIGRSARNRFVGIVTNVITDVVMAQVEIQAGPHRVVSLLSSEAVRELGLEVGSLAIAVVKATNVIVETPR